MTMAAGERGTKALVEKYGERLVCVRHRYDESCGRRYKTVELVIEDTVWRPALRHGLDDIVYLKLLPDEQRYQRLLRSFGASHDAAQGLWRAKYRHALALDIVDRIVPPLAQT